MGCSGLRDLVVWLRLESMNEVREQDGVVDEENWDVDSHNVLMLWVSSSFYDSWKLLTKVSFVSIKSSS